jgi:hypothetical protein
MSRTLWASLSLPLVAFAGACAANAPPNDFAAYGGGATGAGGASASGTSSGPATTSAPPDDGDLGGSMGTGSGAGGGQTVCTHGPDEDGDHDGFTGAQGDCNDCDPNVNPGAIDAAAKGGAEGAVSDADCDGKKELPATCDDGLALDDTSSWSAAKAIDLCQTATHADRRWGVLEARYVRADGTPADPIAVSSFLVPRREALRGGASWRPPPATW